VERSIFLQEIGKVTELAQYLELELGTILLVAEAEDKEWEKSPVDNSEAYEKLRDSVNNNTLGQTLRSIQKKFTLLKEFPEIMEHALKSRNRFTHHVFREFSLTMHTAEGRAEMLKVVEELRSSMQLAYDVASPISDRLVSAHVSNAKKNS